MNPNDLINLFSYTIPSVITGGVAYLLFNAHFKDQQNTRRWLLQKENNPTILPLRLQAYERMTLLMERINPSQLLVRLHPTGKNKIDYQNYLIAQIEQEFEHNLTQQIYVSEKCWSIVSTAKNATIQIIRLTAQKDDVIDSDALRERILTDSFDKIAPCATAMAFIKDEVSDLW